MGSCFTIRFPRHYLDTQNYYNYYYYYYYFIMLHFHKKITNQLVSMLQFFDFLKFAMLFPLFTNAILSSCAMQSYMSLQWHNLMMLLQKWHAVHALIIG